MMPTRGTNPTQSCEGHMTDSVTDSLTVKRALVLINDKMQRDYRYRCTGTAGKNFAPDFVPERTPR
jgi:hypothetical protein